MSLALLLLGVAGATFGAAMLALTTPRRVALRRRIAAHAPAATSESRAQLPWREIRSRILVATERRLADSSPWRRLERLGDRAGVSLGTAELVYISLGAAVGAALLLTLAGATLPLLVLAFAAGLVTPAAALVVKSSRRRRQFDEQLPELLDSLASSLKAGHSVTLGLQSLAADAAPPASQEFDRVLSEMRLGRSLESGLHQMGVRLGSREFEFVLTAITIQQQTGGSLADLFALAAETVRQRQQFNSKLRALTAMGRMSARILVALPFAVAFLLTLINPDYMSPLLHSSTGQLLIVVSLGMMAVGTFLLQRIVSFEG